MTILDEIVVLSYCFLCIERISIQSGNVAKEPATNNIESQTFTFRELATATKNFRQECLIGEGGFGRIVAVKQLDRNGLQGNQEFLVEVLMLSQVHHQNLVNLIGYCADGEQRLLVYEFMPLGSLEDHLLGTQLTFHDQDFISFLLKTYYIHELSPDQDPLDWYTRMKIALSAAQGLEYLHDKANPPIIYRDLKSSNILLDKHYNAKLSDFGLAKLGPLGDKTHVSSRVMGTYGYCAPEYQRTGHLTVKSDVYSFGVVLLELITGQRVIDTTKRREEQNLVAWAQPIFREPRKFPELADPSLEGKFPMTGLKQAVAIAAMCLQEEETTRPLMCDVVTALRFLSSTPKEPNTAPEVSPPHEPPVASGGRASKVHPDEDSALERQRIVAEAIDWGSRHNSARSRAGSGSSM
ncbi:hypothetical protein V2J09_005037 [Rumex salicifolius]